MTYVIRPTPWKSERARKASNGRQHLSVTEWCARQDTRRQPWNLLNKICSCCPIYVYPMDTRQLTSPQGEAGYLEADVRRNKRKMPVGKFSEQVSKFGCFCGFPATYRFWNFGFFRGFPQFLGDPKNSQNADFSTVSRDFEGRAHLKILCGFPAMNRTQNLDLPTVSRDF